ncbi:MAG: hypothetical protein IPN26_06620 [Bacteroidetes bacterium]|nr:hypothetical protein [Bacteroidota bacterium]
MWEDIRVPCIKMNDLVYFTNLFPTDNSTVRQILVADTMLLYIKENFYHSKNDGKAFQKSNLGPDYVIRHLDQFYKYYYRIPPFIIRIPISFIYAVIAAVMDYPI